MDSFRVIPARTDWDCGIATLSMLTNVPYEEVLAAAGRIAPVERRGLWLHEIITISDELGVPLKRKRTYNPATSVGILHVFDKGNYHVCILWQGMVIETDGTIWREWETYLATRKWKPGSLLVRDD